jgi:hypothetical protein
MVEGCASWEDFHNQQACLGCCRPEPIHTSVCKGRRARRDSFGVSLLLCGSQLFFFWTERRKTSSCSFYQRCTLTSHLTNKEPAYYLLASRSFAPDVILVSRDLLDLHRNHRSIQIYFYNCLTPSGVPGRI